MFEIFANWEWWQIALTAVFGTVWIVFIILDQRRKIAAKKLRAKRVQELKERGYSDDVIEEMLQKRLYIYSGEPGLGMSRHFPQPKDGEKNDD